MPLALIATPTPPPALNSRTAPPPCCAPRSGADRWPGPRSAWRPASARPRSPGTAPNCWRSDWSTSRRRRSARPGPAGRGSRWTSTPATTWPSACTSRYRSSPSR
ncbi:hypothetical protein GXW82_40960 [Streptacidiphilus sp. 4-A2]|nr:hypothetical protein [Streptacidiphilus sp. 4-A2]